MRCYLLMSLLAWIACGCAPGIHDLAGRGDVVQLECRLARDPGLVNARGRLGKTPLHYAVTYGLDTALEVLLAHGADINAQDDTGLTPLHVAVMLNRRRAARFLLDHQADLHTTDHFGDTPLHTAALFGQADMAACLLEAGAASDARNREGLTPLDLAQRERKAAVVELLRSSPGINAGPRSGS